MPPSSSAKAPPVPRRRRISSARMNDAPNSRARNARSTLTVYASLSHMSKTLSIVTPLPQWLCSNSCGMTPCA